MGEFFSTVPSLLLAAAVAYLLGALPLADQVSRRHGVDIFSVGTGLAGASNVKRSVGRFSGLLVLIGDLGKGAAAVIFAGFVGVDGTWAVVAVIAVVVGHWKSVFTGFQGGDGLSPLGGAAMALFPVFGLVAVAVALVVALGGQLLPYTSLLSVVFGYLTLVALTIAFEGDTALALGIGGVSGLVLAHALLGHRRRNSVAADGEWENAPMGGEWEEVPDADGATDRSGP